MRPLKIIFVIFLLASFIAFSSSVAQATPSTQALYWEYDLGGGLWKYDYTLYNTSDPVADAGYDLFDFFLNFPLVALSNILSPPDWDAVSDSSSFIDWFSLLLGEPPLGADIAPGSSLDDFSFTSNTQLASLSFDVLLTNPIDPENPVLYSGNTTPIPEPATIILLSSGLAGLGYLKRRRFFNS